jgi:hypothetical protein
MTSDDANAPDQNKPTGPEVPFSGIGGADRIVFRAMREDPAGGPLVGPTARTLGVRPIVDIPELSGRVQPGTGGMSVAPDKPENLHRLRRPPAYGGSGKDPVWSISIDLLGDDLQFRQDSATHGLVEPSRSMTMDELQQALVRTKPFWKKVS